MIREERASGEGSGVQVDVRWPSTLRAAVGPAFGQRVLFTLVMGWWTMIIPTADVSVADHYFHGIERQDNLLGQLFVKYGSSWSLNIVRFG